MRDFIEEWLAYCILQSMQLQTFLFVVGEGANGKSVLLLSLMRCLVARTFRTFRLRTWGNSFRFTARLGKLANVISDAEITDKLIESRD